MKKQHPKIKEIFDSSNEELFNGHNTKRDEHRVKDLLNETGGKYEVVPDYYSRWDIEGVDSEGKTTRVEVRSRTPNTFDTWLIDCYKVEYMTTTFPDDNNYFVNYCEGRAELYDMEMIIKCERKNNVRTKENDGTYALHDYYYFDKKDYIIELTTKQLGNGA